MGKRDPRVDAYIKKAAPFAQPILTEIRETVHASCPDVEETMKWRFPHFVYKGLLCGMASFKEHAALGFWKGSLVTGGPRGVDAMGQFGRLTKRSDLPSKRVLAGYVKKAAALNEQGVKVPRVPKKAAPKTLKLPADSRGRVQDEQEGAGGVRRVQPEPQARVRRVDHRSQERRDARAAARAGDRVDGRGQVAELEV